jgi:hypothetical protein
MTNKVDFTENEFKEIQAESHQSHKSYMEVMDSFEIKENKLEEQSIGLFNTFLTSVGVIAGLGFTALGNVGNRLLFFIGESMLLFLIVFGMFILFSYKKSRGKQYVESEESWHSLLNPRLILYKRFLTMEITKKELFEELNKDDKKVFDFKPVSTTNVLDLDKYFLSALVILIIGIIFLITSFINFNHFERYPHNRGAHIQFQTLMQKAFN